jgi:hypothetical protein
MAQTEDSRISGNDREPRSTKPRATAITLPSQSDSAVHNLIDRAATALRAGPVEQALTELTSDFNKSVQQAAEERQSTIPFDHNRHP